MKIIKGIKPLLVLGAIVYTSSVFAYSNNPVNYGCRDPKFKSFTPAKRKKGEPVPEVEAGSEISFTVSGNADKYSIKLVIKKQKVKLDILDKQTFYKVIAKVPDELNDVYARVDFWAKSKDGLCSSKDGWLIKVKKSADTEAAAVVSEEPVEN